MKEWLVFVSEYVILIIDAMALVVVVYATTEAFIKAVCLAAITRSPIENTRAVWLRFSRWLVAALTFQLAADIVETSITTSWEALGRIAVIAVLRTFLNYFLEKDVTEMGSRQEEIAKA